MALKLKRLDFISIALWIAGLVCLAVAVHLLVPDIGKTENRFMNQLLVLAVNVLWCMAAISLIYSRVEFGKRTPNLRPKKKETTVPYQSLGKAPHAVRVPKRDRK
jgi:Ni/Fe-hydrogenase subunit HybB-like protein